MSQIHRRVAMKTGAAALGSLAAGIWMDSPARADGEEDPGSDKPRLFELGTITYNIAKDWDLETLIKRCEKLGYRAVELRSTHKHGVEPTIGDAQRKAVRRRFQQTQVKLFGLGSACEFHSPDPKVVQKNVDLTKQFIKLAHDVKAIGVKVRPNGLAVKQGVPVAATLKQIGGALAECGDYAQRFGVEVWLEVHGRETNRPEYIRTIMDHCGHPAVGVTWNSNPPDVKDGSIRESFGLLKGFIKCVHINELWSGYPYRELFALLRSIGYSRYTMAEIQGNADPERLLRYYRALWEELSLGPANRSGD